MSDHRFELKVWFAIYGEEYEWEPSLNWNSWDSVGGCDPRVVEWFANCYRAARQLYDQANERSDRQVAELKERAELARLKAKYEPEDTDDAAASPGKTCDECVRLGHCVSGYAFCTGVQPRSDGIGMRAGKGWNASPQNLGNYVVPEHFAPDIERYPHGMDGDGRPLPAGAHDFSEGPPVGYEDMFDRNPKGLGPEWNEVYGGDGSGRMAATGQNVRWAYNRGDGVMTPSQIHCLTCGHVATLKPGDVVRRGDPRLCVHLGGPVVPEPERVNDYPADIDDEREMRL